jgi:branched-chain amino acid transport system ATP-binding protein
LVANVLLEIKDVTVYYSKSMAVQDISLGLSEGEVISIIGANGAGKSTILRALMGLIPVSRGEVYFRGEELTGKATSEIVKKGVILVPEGRQLFPHLSVLNNLKLGATLRRDRDAVAATLEEVYQLFPRLKERSGQKAGTLSGGEQQMLAIGRGLMAAPQLLCMDEPSLGLAPIVVEQLGKVIKDINGRGVSVLLVEQNVHLALGVAERCYALQVGRVVMEGDIATMRDSDIVRKAYFGG